MRVQKNQFFFGLGLTRAGHALPNKLAQDKIYNLCRNYNISVYDLVLDKINKEVSELKNESGRKILFHGSKSGIKGKIKPISRKQCDFGAGFYMGTDPSQALTLICDYEKSKFYIVSIDMNTLNTVEIPANLEWAMLVAYNRGRMEKIKGTPFYKKYKETTENKDLVIGNIANDRMFFVIDNFFIGNITDEALINSLSALELGKQYVAVTQKGCEAVRIEKEIEISYLEKLFVKEISEQNREKGSSMARDICKNYRREGLFFDEILDKASGGAL